MKCILLLAAALTAGVVHAATITDVRISGAGPVTFGQVFAVGDLKKSDVLVGAIGSTAVPLQVDVKATHADGSVRHAIISAQVPKAGTMQLNTGGTVVMGIPQVENIPAVVASATIAGVKYSASPSGAFKGFWLQGPIVNEWQTVAPLTTAAGVAHPHLTARFAIRYYTASKKTRVDVTVENDWAYEPAPQNFTYDADITIGGKSVYSKDGLTHYHHARWRKMFWDGPTVQHNTKYLIASKAVPNYDQSVVLSEGALNSLATTGEPMNIGLATAYMPTTGAHPDIGILPLWASAYVLTMDKRARDGTLATGDGAGSWSMHYRDRVTDRPISLKNYPYMTIAGRASDTGNPTTGKYESFPGCGGICETPYGHDIPHQPSLAYLPYLLTGDFYYLEELQFWAMYDVFAANPYYREHEQALVIPEQIRGQAWALRTLAHAAYITPDSDLLKSDFTIFLANNLDWYNKEYSNNAAANGFGVILNGYAIGYNANTALAPWQDDFFTQSIGNIVDLGFEKAKPLLLWKSKFVISRMTDPTGCWIDAAIYNLTVRSTEASPLFTTFAEAYRASHTPEFNTLACDSPAMAKSLGLAQGEMTGYAFGNTGYPSNMQPALAYAADYAGAPAKSAWAIFDARKVKPNYQDGPQFAIVPRSTALPPVVVPPVTVPVKLPPVVSAGKVTSSSNVKLVKQNPLTVTFIDPAKLALVKTFTGVVATSKGSFTVSDAMLIPGTQYLVIVSSVSKPLDAFLLTVPK